MAEAAGLAVGVLALAGSLKDCIELFSYFSAARSFSSDFELLATKLDVEKFCLLQWSDRVHLLKESYDTRLDNPSTRENVGRTLVCIRGLLTNSTNLKNKYGVREVSGSQVVTLQTPVSSTKTSHFIEEFKRLDIRLGKKRDDVKAWSRCRWAVYDKDKFEKLVEDLTYFVNALDRIVPEIRHPGFELRQTDINPADLQDFQQLRLAVLPSPPMLTDAPEGGRKKTG